MKRMFSKVLAAALLMTLVWTGTAMGEEKTHILVAAAASLEKVFTQQLIPLFEAANPGIHVAGTYDSSGKLQTQIEEGLEADVFLSAAMQQMNALGEQGLIDPSTVLPLLINRIVLIAPGDATTNIDSFERIVEANTIALGDPQSVPAGQYAKEALTSLGVWDQALAKASLGTNVTEVLHWVAEGSADVGIVYATDAASSDKVKVLCEAPEGSLPQQVTYPVGILAATEKKRTAQAFVDFLQSEVALTVFETYGFTRGLNKP